MDNDKIILELALREISLAFDALIADCLDEHGKLVIPSMGAIMRSRGMLPPYCGQALSKKTPNTGANRRAERVRLSELLGAFGEQEK